MVSLVHRSKMKKYFIRIEILKKFLLLLFFMHSSNLFGQEPTLHVLKMRPSGKSAYVTLIDTIYFESELREMKSAYTNMTSEDSVFEIPNLQNGKYIIAFASNGFCIEPMEICVCARCEDTIEYFASPGNSPGQPCSSPAAFRSEHPRYRGGNLALANDFKSSLDKNQKNILLQEKNFQIHFFVTKNNLISDINFLQDNISEEIKTIVIKGITNTKNWIPGKLNGKPADDEFTIDKQTLIKN